MESIHPRSRRSGSSDDCGSFATRRTRSSSITSPTSLTDPTTPYQDSDNGRLGSEFSILRPTASISRTTRVSPPKILALPSWLRNTVTGLEASHPLRAVFPTLRHDAPDSTVAERSPEDLPNYQIPRHGSNQPFCFPSTPRTSSKGRLPNSDTSSDEPQTFSAYHPPYHNDSLLYLRSGSPIHPASASPHSEVATFHTPSNPHPSPSTLINVTKTTHICGFETPPHPASSSNHDLHDPASPATQPDVGCDDVFRFNLSQADFTPVQVPSFKPFVFERPTRVYFDSPIEDPISSDPLEPSDYDPFKLDPEEYKNIGFKWAPFDPRASGTKRELISSEPKETTTPPGTSEVIAPAGQSGC